MFVLFTFLLRCRSETGPGILFYLAYLLMRSVKINDLQIDANFDSREAVEWVAGWFNVLAIFTKISNASSRHFF